MSLCYIVSCNNNNDITDSGLNSSSITKDGLTGCYSSPDKCPVPSYCDDGKGTHLCVYLRFYEGDNQVYPTVSCAKITHQGYDCANNQYSCSYYTTSSNPTAMGSVLPWCNEYCRYTRSVCVTATNGKVYIGSTYFSYPLTEQLWVDCYYVPNHIGCCADQED
jgi:hypothetical protein